MLNGISGTNMEFLSHLDVFDSTADQTAGLKRIPGHIKDLQERKYLINFYNVFQNKVR